MLSNFVLNIHYAHPLVLWLLPFSLLGLSLGLGYIHRHCLPWSAIFAAQQQRHYRHPLAGLLFNMTRASSRQVNIARLQQWLCYATLISLLHICLAQPYRQGQRLPEPPQYRDIIFMVDTSVSMMLRDYLVQGQRTDRMTVVKSVLAQFIRNLGGSRLGLVVFSEQAYTLVPLTSDHELVKFQLQRLQPASLTGRRTDPGKAILTVLNELEPGLREGEKPVLVMLTDANRPVRNIDPRIAAALVKQYGLRLHTIAVGAGSQAARENTTSSLIYQPANFSLLQAMAQAGGGSFFAADSQDSLGRVLQTIQAGEIHHVASQPVFIKIPLYHWPLALALLWILLWQILPLLRLKA